MGLPGVRFQARTRKRLNHFAFAYRGNDHHETARALATLCERGLLYPQRSTGRILDRSEGAFAREVQEAFRAQYVETERVDERREGRGEFRTGGWQIEMRVLRKSSG